MVQRKRKRNDFSPPPATAVVQRKRMRYDPSGVQAELLSKLALRLQVAVKPLYKCTFEAIGGTEPPPTTATATGSARRARGDHGGSARGRDGTAGLDCSGMYVRNK